MGGVFLILLISALSTTEVKAQCPTNIQPISVPWYNVGCTTIWVDFNGVKCEVDVCYCWRDVGFAAPRTEVYVYSATPVDPGCPPANLTYRQILMYSGISILKQNPNNLGWNCPPCPYEFSKL